MPLMVHKKILFYILSLNYKKQQLLAVKSMYIPLSLNYDEINDVNSKKTKQYQNINEAIISLLITYKVSTELLHFFLCYAFKKSGPTFLAKQSFDSKYKVAIITRDVDLTNLHIFAEHMQYYLYSEYLQAKPLQTFTMSLYYMQHHYKFTHYDLHLSNIFIQTLDKAIVLSYHIAGKTYQVKSHYLVRIIDMGSSYIKVDGVSYGVNDSFTLNIGRQRTFNRFYDVYMMFIYY